MSVESEILRIQHNIASAYTKVAEKGGEVPSQPNSANLAAAVQTIPQGEPYIAGDGIDITETAEGPKIGVTTPVQGIVTQAEYDALPEAQQSKGLYVISDGGNGGDGGASAGEVYSTEETRIGTWIDGKPIYRIAINATTPASAGTDASVEVASYSANVEEVIRLSAIITSKTGQKITAPYYRTNDERAWIAYNPPNYTNVQNKNSVRMMVGTAIVSLPITIILEYTKTTDEGGTA